MMSQISSKDAETCDRCDYGDLGREGSTSIGGPTFRNLPAPYSNVGSRGGKGGLHDLGSVLSTFVNHFLTSTLLRFVV